MRRIILTFFVMTLRLGAATWYASANGTVTNGTSIAPWSLPYAVTNTNEHLQPGDTVIVQNGSYVCTETNAIWETGHVLELRKSGTPSAKITYRAQSLWGFSFDGGLLLQSVSNIVIRDFRFFYSGCTNRQRTNIYEFPAGVVEYQPGNEILHNLFDSCGYPGIASWNTTRGKHIAGNVIRFIGYNDWTTNKVTGNSYAGANRGSGMYLQNKDNSAEALVEGNISYYTYTTGIKAYGNTDIWGFRFAHNICLQTPEAGVFYHQDNYPSSGVTVTSNYMWCNIPVRLGYSLGNGNSSNAIVAANYAVSTSQTAGNVFYQADGWFNNSWTNNVGVDLVNRYPWFMEVFGETAGDITSHHIDYNAYHATNTGSIGTNPMLIKETGYSFANWQAQIHGDTHSTFGYAFPSELVKYVFRPSSDTNFVHVAVFNWPTNASTTVDLSAYFPAGSNLKVYDAQDIPNAYTTFVYQGSAIVSLDLKRTNIAGMIGAFPDYAGTNIWSGFDPRFRAFVIYRDGEVKTGIKPPEALRIVNPQRRPLPMAHRLDRYHQQSLNSVGELRT